MCCVSFSGAACLLSAPFLSPLSVSLLPKHNNSNKNSKYTLTLTLVPSLPSLSAAANKQTQRSCWAIAATSALSDRFRVAAWKAGQPIADVTFAPQALVDCGSEMNYTTGGLVAGSCNGGSAHLANQLFAKIGIVDDTCAPYLGVAFTHWAETTCAGALIVVLLMFPFSDY